MSHTVVFERSALQSFRILGRLLSGSLSQSPRGSISGPCRWPASPGGAFVNGRGAISSSSNSLSVNQSSSSGMVDWHSFSIGNGNTVAFNNGSGATLNRVTEGVPSAILGRLTATGSLYLIIPQGMVVGPSGGVTTGGRFVASTLDMCNAAFMSGGPMTLSGTTNASVVNLGNIGSTGGDVFLISRLTARSASRRNRYSCAIE